MSLGGFQNFNLLKMGHFRKYGVEDESRHVSNFCGMNVPLFELG